MKTTRVKDFTGIRGGEDGTVEVLLPETPLEIELFRSLITLHFACLESTFRLKPGTFDWSAGRDEDHDLFLTSFTVVKWFKPCEQIPDPDNGPDNGFFRVTMRVTRNGNDTEGRWARLREGEHTMRACLWVSSWFDGTPSPALYWECPELNARGTFLDDPPYRKEVKRIPQDHPFLVAFAHADL